MHKISIIRLSSLGDIVHTLPAFAALRERFPDAEIRWLVEPQGREILDLVPGIDRIVVLDLKSRTFFREFTHVRREIREREQIALDFQGLIKSGFFTYLSGARLRIGFHRRNLREPAAAVFYTRQSEEISEKIHVTYKNLKLLETLDIRADTLRFPLEVPEAAAASVRERIAAAGWDPRRKRIVINVGAAWETKRWYADKWVEVIEGLKPEGIRPLLLWGDDLEQRLAREVSIRSGAVLAPSLSLKEVVALIPETDLVVSGDTLALQLACAFSRPVVGIFGPTDPRRNGPFRREDQVVHHTLECSYCYRRTCSDLKCLDAITPQEVSQKILELV